MPGILYHLAFAEKVCDSVSSLNKVEFMAGNLIPDLATNRDKSHYRKKASVNGFWVPDMESVKRDLFKPYNSLIFGMYCHLYLDYRFIEEFLLREFTWVEKDSELFKVVNPRNGKVWDVDTFFSQEGMYGSYTEINQMMIKDNRISLETIEKIPEVLPDTGVEVYDVRREKTWKTELDEYFALKKEYTGEVFDYNRLWESIESFANQFVNEL